MSSCFDYYPDLFGIAALVSSGTEPWNSPRSVDTLMHMLKCPTCVEVYGGVLAVWQFTSQNPDLREVERPHINGTRMVLSLRRTLVLQDDEKDHLRQCPRCLEGYARAQSFVNGTRPGTS